MRPNLAGQKVNWRKATFFAAFAAFIFVVLAVAYIGGCILEYEYPFWPTLWIAKRTKTSDGKRVTDLIRSRCGAVSAQQHWHHCTWCDVVYPHAPHLAVMVIVNDDQSKFYLFDWDLERRKLLSMTVRTAKLLPELIPSGYVVEPLGLGLNPQLYHDDEPCQIVPAGPAKRL